MKERGHIYGHVLVKLLRLAKVQSPELVPIYCKERKKYLEFIRYLVRGEEVNDQLMIQLDKMVSYIKQNFKEVMNRVFDVVYSLGLGDGHVDDQPHLRLF